MKKRKIDCRKLKGFEAFLKNEERSAVTIDKYMRDVRRFSEFVGDGEVDKQTVMEYKCELGKSYAISGANSMIGALNTFLRFSGWTDLCVKQFKVQKKTYCTAQKELSRDEYKRLVATAEKKKNERLSLVIQTICGTGIRVSELSHITVEAVRQGEATVSCKGKTRTVFIVPALQKKLLRYSKEHHITSGAVFVTKYGKPMNRCNIWKEMKALCNQAGVLPDKVFPHNLRHLFARTFYSIEKDIAKLADILGHSSVNTTRIYIITTGEEHRRRMESMRLVI